MKKMRMDYRHIITAVITAGLILVSVFCFTESYVRIGESARDFGLAVAGFFCELFGIEYGFNAASLNNLSSAISLDIIVNSESIKNKFVAFGKAFISRQNFFEYIMTIVNGARVLIYVIPALLLLIVLFAIVLKRVLAGENNAYNKQSRPLRIFKKFELSVWIRIKCFVKSYIEYLKLHRAVLMIWIAIGIISLNLVAIVLELLSNFFYISIFLDFSGIFIQIQKLLTDLSMWTRIPIWVWIPIVIAIILHWRKSVGLKRLYSRESKNAAFVKNLSSVGVITAFMGAGKNRFGTDVMMTKQKQFRSMAYEIMLEVDYLFPEFPWAKLQNKLRALIKKHYLYNISSCEQYACRLKNIIKNCTGDEDTFRSYERNYKNGKISDEFLFGYEWKKFGLYKSNGIKMEFLGDVLEDYIKAYFIYSSPTSMIFSNYAISIKADKKDMGNLPIWSWNWFEDNLASPEKRQNAHVLDMDMLRLGKKVVKNNRNANAFEYGLVAISEIDKERGNQFDTRELKKETENANQKNDNFNASFKMSRQMTNIRGRGFFFALVDMQRLGSLNLDLVELGDNLVVGKSSDLEILVPFFAFDELIYQIIVPWFTTIYTDYSFRRADRSLLIYLIKKIACAVNLHYVSMYNRFGCIEHEVTINEKTTSKYFIMPKKIYCDVYSTDMMASFFRKKASYSKKGINDIPTFKGVRATADELAEMNSYMVNSWLENLSDAEKDNLDE